MKLLFVYESLRVFEDKEGNYYTGWSQKIWDRYLNTFDNMSMICRKDTKIYEYEFANNHFELLDKDRIKFIEIPDLHSSLKSYLNKKTRLNLYKKIEQEVKASDYIIVRLPNKISVMTINLAKKYNKPFLVEVVGCAWDSLWNHSYKGKILAFSNYMSMKKALKSAPYALYVTNEFLQQRYLCDGKTIGVSDVTLPELDERVLQNRILKVNTLKDLQPIIIGTLGAINVKYKGQEYVIKAISKLKKKGYNFEYHIAGGGDNSYLKSIAEKYDVLDQVKFLGALPHEDVFQYLDNLDVYIQPSKTEGLPRALVEAMSRACPVLGSRVGGIPELVNEDFTFNNGSVSEICKLLKKIDKQTLKKEALRSFEKAKVYENSYLDKRRTSFFEEFIESVGICNDKSITRCK
ncbi:glycosyltransferase [Robertmurraya sp. FSL R5-0851]|uniref:glycosyltransferase n=1 Tax=Robertmurraya sp. FSL R5-0851 TaxID=2921584 RepID=UPI0030FB2967